LGSLHGSLGSAYDFELWVGTRWVFNPSWSLELNLLWTVFLLCFGPFVLGLGCWGFLFSVCNSYVRDHEGIYAFVYFARLFPYLSLTVNATMALG